MCSFRILSLVSLIALQGTPTMAANEFEDSIPVDVAEALFDFGDTGRFAVDSEIMDAFPAFQIPGGFTVLGSAYFMRSMRVALSTNLELEEAVEAIEESFLDEDWETVPVFSPIPGRTGFVSANQIESRRRGLCHDQFGQLSISTRAGNPDNQIVLSMSADLRRSWGTCAQLRAQMEQQMSMMQGRGRMGLQQYMPRLLIPEEGSPGQRPAFMIGSTSSSNNTAEADVELEINWSLDEVYDYFADQMSEQEWTLDSASSGSLSASGIWTRSPEGDMNLVGTLNVLSMEENRFQLRLSIENLGGRGGSQGGRVLRSN